ncbi:ATP-binding protein [Granulicella sp. L60]|uniref:ATP-binding protein n=1 Tax=Granulicella sp. L60 TaxID=1641866 RepID=UPI00131ACA78|nr:ATP-binding protein [Granulicella sp. L60]
MEYTLEYEAAQKLAVTAAKVLQPRSPIRTRELFAGRWNELTTVANSVAEVGLHALIYGERGVGKTSLSNVIAPTIWAYDDTDPPAPNPKLRLVIKAVTSSGDDFAALWEKLFKEVLWRDDKPTSGFLPGPKPAVNILQAYGLQQQSLTVDTVRRVLTSLPEGVFIIDEFDRAAPETSREFTDLIKALSDLAVDVTIVLVGVADTVDKLIADHASIGRQLVQVHLPRMLADELRGILTYAEKSLPVKFNDEASDLIIKTSQGLPHYTHLIGLESIRHAALKRYSSQITRMDVFEALKTAVKHAEQSTAAKYAKATHSAQKDALYKQIILACAITATKSMDSMGYFNPAALGPTLGKILNRAVTVATFNNHLSDFMHAKRGSVLEREGQARSYRYRFQDPLLVPYVFMHSLATGLITDKELLKMLV